jgi:hypothetical protein
MTSPDGSAKPLSSTALRLLVTDLAGKIDRLEHEAERLRLDNSNLHASNQALKDEIARLKNLLPRPPFKPSGQRSPSATLSSIACWHAHARNPSVALEPPHKRRHQRPESEKFTIPAPTPTIDTYTDKSHGPGALPQALQVVAHAKEVRIQSFRSTVHKPLAMPVTSAHVLKAWVHDVRCSAALMLEGRQKRFAT